MLFSYIKKAGASDGSSRLISPVYRAALIGAGTGRMESTSEKWSQRRMHMVDMHISIPLMMVIRNAVIVLSPFGVLEVDVIIALISYLVNSNFGFFHFFFKGGIYRGSRYRVSCANCSMVSSSARVFPPAPHCSSAASAWALLTPSPPLRQLTAVFRRWEKAA